MRRRMWVAAVATMFLAGASPAVSADIKWASKLFRVGDYLHAMYAMRNAALHAQGVTSKPVTPHRSSLQEAATSTNAIFSIHPQRVYGTTTPVTPPPVWFGVSPN